MYVPQGYPLLAGRGGYITIPTTGDRGFAYFPEQQILLVYFPVRFTLIMQIFLPQWNRKPDQQKSCSEV